MSYPSIASSSEVSFPAVAGVACILDASDRTRSRIPIHRRCFAFLLFLTLSCWCVSLKIQQDHPRTRPTPAEDIQCTYTA